MSVNITRGENKTITIKLRDQDGDPFDMSGFDEFTVCFPTEGDPLEITQVANTNGSVTTKITGETFQGLTVVLKAADSANLKVGERQDIGVILNNNATPNPRSETFERVLNVKAGLC